MEEQVTLKKETYDSLIETENAFNKLLDNDDTIVIKSNFMYKEWIITYPSAIEKIKEIKEELEKAYKESAKRHNKIREISRMSIFQFIKWKRKQQRYENIINSTAKYYMLRNRWYNRIM